MKEEEGKESMQHRGVKLLVCGLIIITGDIQTIPHGMFILLVALCEMSFDTCVIS